MAHPRATQDNDSPGTHPSPEGPRDGVQRRQGPGLAGGCRHAAAGEVAVQGLRHALHGGAAEGCGGAGLDGAVDLGAWEQQGGGNNQGRKYAT